MKAFILNTALSSLRLFNKSRSLFFRKADTKNYKPISKSDLRKYNRHRHFGPLPKLCYAPWTNLFFNTDGKAIICCKNTKLILGKYPENSIHDIWFNPKIEKLRKYIKNNDLSFGCYKCKEAIVQNNISTMTSIYFDKYGIKPIKRYPKVIEFELSNRCNLECIMCSGRVSSQIQIKRENQELMKMQYDSSFVNQLEEFIPHLEEAKFFGGEPFLINIYYEIWERIIKIKPSVRIIVQTNATILNDRIKNIFHKSNMSVSISLDSLVKENYEKIRINADFDKTMENIKWFGDQMQNLGIVATPFRNNWKDIPDIVKFCNRNNYLFSISPVFHPEHLALWSWDIENLDKILAIYKNMQFEENNQFHKRNNNVFWELVNSIKYWRDCKKNEDDFNLKYSSYIAQQEIEENKSSITESETTDSETQAQYKVKIIKLDYIHQAKRQLLERLTNHSGDENKSKQVSLLFEKFCKTYPQLPNPEIIFCLIESYELEQIIKRIDELSDNQIIELFSDIYKEADSKYKLIDE